MIKNKVLVSRYAEAFLNFARLNCGPEKALADLGYVKKVIRDNPGFVSLMNNPEISYQEKCSVIEGVFKNEICPELFNFLKLLVDKKRFGIFTDIAEYLRVKYSHHGQVDVILKTAFPLELELIVKIQEALKKRFKKNMRFYIDLDGSLLGGVQVIIGNTILDGSIKKRLSELKDSLNAVRLA